MIKLKNLYLGLKGQGPFKRFIKNFFITRNAWGLLHKRSHLRDDGNPKVMYHTIASAGKAAEKMGKKHNKHFSVYKCIFCEGYHIGKNRDNKYVKVEEPKKMTRWGIGPLFALLTILYSMVVYYLTKISNLMFTGFENFGIFLIVIGFCLFLYNALTIDKYFNNKKLRTTGLYGYVRNPIYASWIVLIIPGIVLYWGSIPGLMIPFVSYFIHYMLISKEDNYLLGLFGTEYVQYRLKVNSIIPKIIKSKNK